VSRYIIDAGVAIKWFVPEIHSDDALRARQDSYRLHIPAFMLLEFGNVLTKKIRRQELSPPEANAILKELKYLPLHRHADDQLFPAAYQLALDTHRSLYDCLYLALAEVIDGIMVTADRKFCTALADGPYARRVLWVEDLPQFT
jgi:predicted nucleic acid-binding protein